MFKGKDLLWVRAHFRYFGGGMVQRLKAHNSRVKIGEVTPGSLQKNGYMVMRIDGHTIKMHRLIYWLVHGWMPREIDHINGKRADNRIENLRACSHAQNMANSKTRVDSKGRGTYYDKRSGKWRGMVRVAGRAYYTAAHTDRKLVVEWTRRLRKQKFGEFSPL